MRKRIFPRIVWFLLLNCVIFILLVTMQFPRTGNFSVSIGEMLVNGRYAPETGEPSEWRPLNGAASIAFGGLEFRLDFSEYIAILENGAAFMLPGGTELSFTSNTANGTSNGAAELRINGKFSDDASSVEIPFRTQRASVIRDSDINTLNIMYKGSLYQFSRPLSGDESGMLVLVASAPGISYHAVTSEKEFNPIDYIVPQAETAQAFTDALSRWIDRNYVLWSRMGTQTDEDTVIAWCGEAVRRGNYRSAVSAVPVSFSSDPQRTWASAVYQFDRRIGVWERAVRTFGAFEREKINLVTRLLAEKGIGLFAENHLIEFLAVRGNNDLINSLLAFAQGTDPSILTLEAGPGILENCSDLNKWRPDTANPFMPLAEQVLQLAEDGLRRNGDQVLIFADSLADAEFNLRFGAAAQKWAEITGNDDWAGLGRSIVLSVISLGDDSGSVPASLAIRETGEFVPSAERSSSAKLYRLLGISEYLPHAAATGTDGIWAWTAASSVNVTRSGSLMDIFVRFPVGETHYVMLRNVPPFPQLQIHGVNWRRAVDFESYYNSSGWYYFEQERILILKLSHRSTTENVKIYFTVPRAPEPAPVQQQDSTGQPEQAD